MTRGSVLEYARAVRNRYLAAERMEKGRILDEFVKVTDYHRKAAIIGEVTRDRHAGQ